MHFEDLQGTLSACIARQRPPLHVGRCFGPPGIRPAPLGRALRRCHDDCTCGAGLTHHKLASHKAGHLQGTLRTGRVSQHACTAKQRPALHVGGYFGPSGTRPAPLRRAGHRCHDTCSCGAGLTHEKLASHKAGHLQGILRTGRARQAPAPQASRLRCTSRDALALLGPSQHPWDLRCIQPKALARVAHPSSPETGLAQRRPLARHLWHLQGASATCTARERLLLHVHGCCGSPGRRPVPLGLALYPAQGASTCGAPLTHQKPALT